MGDTGTIVIAGATVLSALAAPAALYRAGRATVELVRLQASPVGAALERAYAEVVAEEVPAEMLDLITRLD